MSAILCYGGRCFHRGRMLECFRETNPRCELAGRESCQREETMSVTFYVSGRSIWHFDRWGWKLFEFLTSGLWP